ncbi:Krueppel-like factor 5, partial [Acromyrmex echinatior]
QTSDLDTLLCRQDLDRLQRLDEDESDARDAREPSVHMEDFFEVSGPTAVCRPPQASFVSSRSQPAGAGQDDDVFLRPPLWEDITSSIQKLDPENADMLGSQSHIKMETDDVTPPPVLSPVEIKTEPLPPPPTLHLLEGPATNPSQNPFPNPSSVQHVVHHRTTTSTTATTAALFKSFPNSNNNNNNNNNNSRTVNSNNTSASNPGSNNDNGNGGNSNNNSNNNGGSNSDSSTTSHHQPSGNATSPLYSSMTRLMYISPLTPPISDPSSPIGAGPPRRTPPPPYPQPGPILNPAHRIQPPSMSTKFNRRNNPELEKRRVHHCDFIGCTKVYTKSSHLKAHQRIHTGTHEALVVCDSSLRAKLATDPHLIHVQASPTHGRESRHQHRLPRVATWTDTHASFPHAWSARVRAREIKMGGEKDEERRETVSVSMAGMRVAIRQERRIDAALPQAHRG